MTVRHGVKCSKECDFLVAAQGHDSEVISLVFNQYDQCPNCGADLEEVCVREPKMGFLEATAPVGNSSTSGDNQ